MYWSESTTHNPILPPVVLMLPFWACPVSDKAFPVQHCKLSTMQALAGTRPACAEVQQQGKSSSHKKALPRSELHSQPQPKVPRTFPTTCSRRVHSQPLAMGHAGMAAVTSGPGNPIPASFTAQPWAPPCRHHRKKGANPDRVQSTYPAEKGQLAPHQLSRKVSLNLPLQKHELRMFSMTILHVVIKYAAK